MTKPELSKNAIEVLKQRYLIKDDSGNPTETPQQLFRRVATSVAAAEKRYNSNSSEWEEKFYNMMVNLEFLPNSPTLMNAGTNLGQLSACFVLPVDDSILGIFEAVKEMAIIFQSGGGTGFSFSKLRPKGDVVRTTKGVASGPVSFMKIFDVATEVVKQGGRRRGANMGVLRVDHPDIVEFINAKSKNEFQNFNLSVSVTNEFMEAVAKNRTYDLINPRTKEVVRKENAKSIFDMICENAWKTGDPGILFIDKINDKNPTPNLGKIEATNPCAEIPALAHESCTLGSINLAKMLTKKGRLDWEKLKETVTKAVRFLDDVIDVNKLPLPQIEKITRGNRKIGLGIMGFADLLFILNIKYDSAIGIHFAEKLMKFIEDSAVEASVELAKRRGTFPNYRGSIWEQKNIPVRNATLTAIAPTGTLSIIADCSSGIEPAFALSYIKTVMSGTRLPHFNQYLVAALKKNKKFRKDILQKVMETGKLSGLKLPIKLKNIFITATEIKPDWHIRMQAAFQKHVDNSISKTINFPANSTVEDFKKAFMFAHEMGCKSVSAYRYGSKGEQVLTIGMSEKECKSCGVR